MLKLIDVKKIYKTKVGDVAAMDGVTVEFPDNGMIFINGKSGSGKTTLLNVVGGLDGFDSGEISIDGKNFSTFTASDYDSYRNTFVGFVFQEYNLLPDYTVGKNIQIANELQGKETSKERLKEMMAEFDIAGLENRKISELSGGQKQRVAIVRSLVKDPKIIMADEPTGALDSVTGIQVVETLKKLSKDKLVIVVSHDLELAEKYADRIIRIVDGQIVEDVSITDTEIKGNLHEDGDALTVKTGSQLNAHETEELLKAIREKRKINFTEKVVIRQKQKTKEVKDSKVSTQAKLINSKMKFSSAAELGVKSLGVKPGRLIFTVLLSVIAFAVFGLFDTIAAYNATKTVQSTLRKSDYRAVSVYQEYGLGSSYYSDSTYTYSNFIKLSDESINQLSSETGFNFRPVYNLSDASLSDYIATHSVTYLTRPNGEEIRISVGKNTTTNTGALYYIPEVTGFVEFKNDEIVFEEKGSKTYAKVLDENGFNLTLVAGNLPEFVYDKDKDTANDTEVAITKYLAESILFWSGGNANPDLMDFKTLIGSSIQLNSVKYTISGIYDSGELPAKYDELKTASRTSNDSLGEDLKTYLNAGLYFNFLVGEGFTDYLINDKKVINNAPKQRIPSYYVHQEYELTFDRVNPYRIDTGNKQARFYDAKDIAKSKILLFDSTRDKQLPLADDEVLICLEYLDDLYSYEKNRVFDDSREYYDILKRAEDYVLLRKYKTEFNDEMLNSLKTYIDTLKALVENEDIGVDTHMKTLTISTNGHESKQFKVVGVYTGVDIDVNLPSNSTYPIAMTTNGLASIGINTNQGLYGRVIAPMNNSRTATGRLAEKMTSDDVRLIWYGNNVLSLINEGAEIILGFSNLFLYVAIVLAAFSIFMLYNYISASIVAKKQSIGVLRALGSGRKDIFLMFMTESLIIALINGVLASVVAGVGCIFVNAYIRNVMNLAIDFALYDVRQVIFIMIASIFTAIASSLIPILKIAKEKPVKLIREQP